METSGIVGVDMNKGLGHYMAMADETVAELLSRLLELDQRISTVILSSC